MNSSIDNAVLRFQDLVRDGECEDGIVRLTVNPDIVPCQFERGACMEAEYGGRVAHFVTNDPVRATTKIGFLIDAVLDNPAKRSAACAIMNVVSAFFCTARRVRACPKECHVPCLEALSREYCGKTVFLSGDRKIPGLIHATRESADILFINGEGLINEAPTPNPGRKIIFIGPSVSGTATLNCSERWCPHGSG